MGTKEQRGRGKGKREGRRNALLPRSLNLNPTSFIFPHSNLRTLSQNPHLDVLDVVGFVGRRKGEVEDREGVNGGFEGTTFEVEH